MGFDFDAQQRRQLGYKLIDLINDYFSSLPDRPVQLPASERTFGQLSERMPELGEEATRVLDDISHELIDKGFHVPSANYFGLMNPTPTYMSVLAEALVAALNPQLATLARSQLASKIEQETVRWIGERVVNGSGVPKTFDGTFTSGGNEANFSAIALALAAHFPQWVEEGALAVGKQPVLYASGEAHHSLDKSAGLLGLGRKALRRIAVNENAQMDLSQLEATIAEDERAGRKPFLVVGTAGTTNSGAIDDILGLADICRRHGLWFHIDGAYGAAAVFSNQHRKLVKGIEQADSITIDPHKWLAMPFAAGVILTSRPELLQTAFGITTPYMPKIADAPLIDNFKISTQWSRRMNSLKFYLTLRVHGRQAYEELIDRQLELKDSFATWARKSDVFELAAPPVLPIINLRLKDATLSDTEREAAHKQIVEEVTRDGKQWISHTHVAGRSVLRMMVISYLTEERHLQQLEHALLAAASRLRSPAVATSNKR